MIHRRRLAFALCIASSSAACTTPMRQIPLTRPDDVAELADGVYFRHGDLTEHGHCNNGFVIFDDFVLVVDANFPSGAEACLGDIRAITDKPVRFVFDTHHHGDHAYGNPIWSEHGATPLAHENVTVEMQRYEPGRWREARETREDLAAIDRDAPMPPTMTYVEKLVVDDGTRRVEFLHFGTAHTRGDGFAYLPNERILFSGDAVVNGPHNYMGDGDTGSWLDVLDALAKLDVDIVAPGHGPPADASLIALQRRYIATLRDAVAAGLSAGKTVEEMQSEIVVPDDLKRYVGDMFPAQIEKIASEMQQ